MKNILCGLFFLCFFPGIGVAQLTCNTVREVQTPLGNLLRQECESQDKPNMAVDQFILDGKVLISGAHPITFEDRNKEKTLFVIQGAYDPTLYCPTRMFLIDLTGDKSRVYAFGVKNACAEHHWASWGKKRSVIAIKDNIRFTYSNGKFSPPPNDFGDGTPLSRRYPEDGKPQKLWPFIEELQIK